jgi:hypothetical protein
VLLDTLQDQLTELRAQNAKLRRVVADRLPPELASQVLLQCTTEESTLLAPADESDAATPSNGHASTSHSSTGKDPKILMEPDYRLMHSLIHSQQNFLLPARKRPKVCRTGPGDPTSRQRWSVSMACTAGYVHAVCIQLSCYGYTVLVIGTVVQRATVCAT